MAGGAAVAAGRCETCPRAARSGRCAAVAKHRAAAALARINTGAAAMSWPAASQALPEIRLLLDFCNPASIVRPDRRRVASQVGPAQRSRIDPAAAGEPPAALGNRPARELAGFVTVDEAQLIGCRLLDFDHPLLRCSVFVVARQMQHAGRPQRSGRPAAVSAAKMRTGVDETGARQSCQAVVVERGQRAQDAGEIARGALAGR
jgi:hypothetical protein